MITSGRKTSSYVVDIASIEGLSVIVDWCYSRGLIVEFIKTRNGGLYDHEDKRINVSCHLRPEKQLHTLLHECGHHLVEARGHNATDRFGNGYRNVNPDILRTFVHEVDLLDEEFEAWSRGLRLAERLNVSVNVESYNSTKAKCIKTHLKAALKVDGYRHDDEEEVKA